MTRLAAFALAAAAWGGETALVLPLANAGKAANVDWIGDSVAETVVDALAAEGVGVVAPEQVDTALMAMGVKRYAQLTRATAMEAAVNSDAGLVAFGECEVTPGAKAALRIRLEILDVRQLRRIGEFTVTGSLEDLSALQNSLAWQALRAMAPESALTEEAFRAAHPPIRIDALENYVRGVRTASPDQKHRLLTTAARLAPGFSQPCFHLGRLAFFSQKNYTAAAAWFQKVTPTGLHYREALFYLGLSRFHTGEFQPAASTLRQLAATVPLPEVLNNLGAALSRLNSPDAVEAFQKAVETNPADPDFHFNLGYALWRTASFDAAAESLRAALQRNPDDSTATILLGRCLKKEGPRAGELRLEAQERLKTDYNESAWLALKAMLGSKKEQ